MKLLLFKTFWGHEGSFEEGMASARAAGFDGIEAPSPRQAGERAHWRSVLETAERLFIAEITTGCAPGCYVPTPGLSLQQHFADFEAKLAEAIEMKPLKVNCMAGSDLWEASKNCELLGRCIESAAKVGLPLTLETHRSRATFHPLATQRLLTELPALRLTCDFSHWCCVCEQLVLDALPALLESCAERADHFHARVGYDQGPQIPHPAAPEYHQPLTSHLRWWRKIWEKHASRGAAVCTATPEFGPDGYLHTLPFSRLPVADVWELNQWMGKRLREEFEKYRFTAFAD